VTLRVLARNGLREVNMANYDKIPFKNRDIDFFGGKKKKIRNMRQEGQYVELKPGEQSTHLMYHQGKEVFPSIFPKDKNTKSHDPKDWIDLPNKEAAYNEAKKRGEVVRFATNKRAEKIGMGAWKQGEARKEAMQNYRQLKKAKNGSK
jgi:hypothetical protein